MSANSCHRCGERSWNAAEFSCTRCNRVINFEERLPGLRCALCPHCHHPLRSARGRAEDQLRELLSACKQYRDIAEEAAKRWNAWLRGGRDLAEALARMEQLGPLSEQTDDQLEEGTK